jgi:hypothetical protein
MVKCALMLHNFIRRATIDETEDEFYRQADAEAELMEDDIEEEGILAPGEGLGDAADVRAIHAWRDEMAQNMWDTYLARSAELP